MPLQRRVVPFVHFKVLISCFCFSCTILLIPVPPISFFYPNILSGSFFFSFLKWKIKCFNASFNQLHDQLFRSHMQLCFLPLRFNAAEIHIVFQLHISVTFSHFLQFCNSQQPCEKPLSNPIQPALKQKKKIILICLSSSFFSHFFTSLLRFSRTGSCKNRMHFHLNPWRCHRSSNICTFLVQFFNQFFHSSAFFQTKSLLLSHISFCFLQQFLNVLLSSFSSF